MGLQRAQLEMQCCNVVEQTEELENPSPWTEAEPHWLISVWLNRSSIQDKIQDNDTMLR